MLTRGTQAVKTKRRKSNFIAIYLNNSRAKVQKKSHICKNIRDFFAFAAILVLILTFGIHWEPTFANPFALFENLADAPERGEGKDPQEDGDIGVLYE